MGTSSSNPDTDGLILGQPRTGKTTLFETLTWKQSVGLSDNLPTYGFNYEYMDRNSGVQIGLWDVGGGE